jgi:hypothetical protein
LKLFSGILEEDTALEMYMKKYTNLATVNGTDRGAIKRYEYLDWYKGRKAGEGVEIHHGVEGKENGIRLLGTW